MFYGCSSLEELKIKNLDTKNVANMEYMFYGCSSLEELKINNFDTNNVKIRCMFFGCSEKLKTKIRTSYNINERAFEGF